MIKLGFIGTGRITGALVKGLCTSTVENTIIYLSPRNKETSVNIANKFENVYRLESNQNVIENSNILFIALPAIVAEEILTNLLFKQSHIVVSLIPSIKHTALLRILSPATKISRAIPLPTVVNHNCPVAIYNSEGSVKEIISHLGEPIIVNNENHLHALWAMTGLIAPYYDFLNELTEWAVSKGIDESLASAYIAQMYHSISSASAKESKIDFNELVKNASTPKGLNEQAVNEIREKGIGDIFRTALDNLLKRFQVD